MKHCFGNIYYSGCCFDELIVPLYQPGMAKTALGLEFPAAFCIFTSLLFEQYGGVLGRGIMALLWSSAAYGVWVVVT